MFNRQPRCHRKSLRPVALRPSLSEGLPLFSWEMIAQSGVAGCELCHVLCPTRLWPDWLLSLELAADRALEMMCGKDLSERVCVKFI
jgi:hypothetical protein